MPNHLHLIISSPTNNLSDTIRDLKKFTSAKIIKAIEENNKESRRNWMLWIFKKAGENNERNNSYQFWQQDNQPIECITEEIFPTRMIKKSFIIYRTESLAQKPHLISARLGKMV